MTATGSLNDRLRQAAVYMSEKGWTQGTEQDEDGKVCLTGAVRLCAMQNGDEHIIRAVMCQRGTAEGWNDSDGRIEADVKELLTSFEITDRDLELTFGPQWEPIVGLVRVVASLSPAQVTELAAAKNAAGAAAGDAAWAAKNAAWAAAGDAAWAAAVAGDAAGAAAGAAARDAAGAAAVAGDAARALIVRDLIGQGTFTQQHYDTLTGPLASVVGPLHPGDTL